MSTDGDMETKQVPGYVPAPVVNADVVEREPAADADTDKDSAGKAADDKSTAKSTTKSGGTTASK